MTRRLTVIISILALCFTSKGYAQLGISVSPPRVYYTIDPGQTGVNDIVITNVSDNNTLELSITLGDWMYNEYGENIMYPADSLKNSCAGWVNIMGSSYLSLKPKQSETIKVAITVPPNVSDTITTHTAMLYVTQMNPIDDVNEHGANIKVSVRSGIKLFQRTSAPRHNKIDIRNLSLNKTENAIFLEFKNEGNVWIDGSVGSYLFNKATGKEIALENIMYYTMPNDLRILKIPLPANIEKGNYTATVMIDYGDSNNIEAAELEFTYE